MPILHNPAATDAQLHELIAHRWSPRSFDDSHKLNDEQIHSLLEAARWSPSSMNAQQWRFLVGVGKVSEPSKLSQALLERELAPRSRKPLTDLMLKGLN